MLFNTLLVIVLSVSGVLSQGGWGVTYTPKRICALKESSVDMHCTYSYPTFDTVQKTFWFIEYGKSKQEPEDLSQKPEYSRRVEYLGNQKNDCTFRINQLRESDSGIEYKFRFLTNTNKYAGTPGVTLEFTDLRLMVNPDSVTEGENVSLICNTTCTLTGSPAFIWYRDGSHLSITDQRHQFRASSEDRGRYTCAVKGNEHLHSPIVALNVRYSPKSTSVSVRPSGEIVEGSSVTLTCSSDANPPVQSYTWFKKNDTGVWQEGSGQSLNFSNVRSWDSGQYYCESQNRHGAQNASALLVTVQGRSLIATAAAGLAAILALVFLGVLCVRRRKSTNEAEGGRQGIKSPIYGNVSGMAVSYTGTQGTDRDDGEVPFYSSVQPASTRNQEQVLHSTVQPASTRNQEQVLYSTVQPASTRNQEQVLYSSVQPASTRNQEQVLYSTVQPASTHNQEQVLYSTVQPASTHNQEQVLNSSVQNPLPQSEEGVQYASIKFLPSSAAPRSPAPSVKEDCVLYSTVRMQET